MTGDRSRPRPARGHRSLPHTGDLCVEAWAPTREECIAEAVRAMVCSFADIPAGARGIAREYEVTGDTDGQLLAAVLDEVVYRMETADELPADVAVERSPEGVRLRCATIDTAAVTQTGAVPKAVSLHGLRLAPVRHEWVCRVTLDV